MYTKYNYSAGATTADILADVVALLTGTVAKASLSASCDKPNTEIYAPSGDNPGYNAAGWTLHDDAAGTNIKVVKAPVVDDGTFFKYVMLDFSNASYAQISLYETWNATAHTGTNLATVFATGEKQRIDLAGGGVLAIGASARYIMMQSNIAAGIGGSTCNEWIGIFERSRLAPWDTVANAYPPVVNLRGNLFGYHYVKYAYASRYKNPAGGDITGINATVSPVAMGFTGAGSPSPGIGVESGGHSWSSSIKVKVPDGVGGFYTPLNEIQVRSAQNAFEGGSISSICDVWNTVSYPNNLDEVTKSGVTYIIWQNTSLATATAYSATAGNASANTALPKG